MYVTHLSLYSMLGIKTSIFSKHKSNKIQITESDMFFSQIMEKKRKKNLIYTQVF